MITGNQLSILVLTKIEGWKENRKYGGSGAHIVWYTKNNQTLEWNEVPFYAISVDIILPLLEKYFWLVETHDIKEQRELNLYYKRKDGIAGQFMGGANLNHSFARAACIALLRARSILINE